MKNKVNMTPPQETNKAPITDLNEMKICELSDKEFRIILRKHRQLKEIRKIIHEENENLARKYQPSKTNPNILELKNTKIELKNSIESFKSRLDHTKEKISDLEDRTFEITQSKEQKEGRMKKSAEGLEEFMGHTKKKQYSHLRALRN